MKNSTRSTPPKIRNRNDRMRVVSILPDAPEKSLTQQQFKDECDINRIVKNAMRGIAPKYTNRGIPRYTDTSNLPDIAEAYNIIRRAEDAFMTLPAQLRLELKNDPANIDRITKDQLQRYKLAREDSTPQPAVPAAPAAGQAATAGTEPAKKKASSTPSPE